MAHVRILAFLGAVVLGIVLGGCAGSGASSGASSAAGTDRIVVSELEYPIGGLTAYDIVERERPNWLLKRCRSTIMEPSPIKVYVDNTGSAYGTVEALREIEALNVAVIEHFSAQEAQTRFGMGNLSGAILVRTRPLGH
ncbi:MAG: hypothetical protein ABEK84_06915 [Salinibacter sp.]